MKITRFAMFLPLLLLTACSQGGNSPVPSTSTTLSSTPTILPSASQTQSETSPASTSTSTSGDYTATAKELVTSLTQGDFAKAEQNFDDVMKQQLPPDKLSTTWKGLITQVGAFKQQLGSRTATIQGFDVVYVTCEFENANLDVQVTFDKDGKIGGLFFKPAAGGSASPTAATTTSEGSPAYVKRDAFQEKDVQVGKDEWILSGTLSLPFGAGPFPAVALVQGSGPQDRDETIGPNKPFQDLAWGLASQGIAVLRYDKRTLVYREKMQASANTVTLDQETTDDALAAVDLLRSTGKIDKNKIYALGHSLGGMDVPRIGTKDPGIAGLVVMAGPTRPFEDVILDQYTYIFSLDGTPTTDEQKQLSDLKAQIAKVKSQDLSKDTPPSQLPLGLPASYWLDLRDYHPAEVAKVLKQPMLILQGEADYQVTMQDFQGWKDALQSRGNVEFKSYPHLYHLFMPAQSDKAKPDDYKTPGHVAEQVVSDIASWIKKQ